jgi:hypothetical protein
MIHIKSPIRRLGTPPHAKHIARKLLRIPKPLVQRRR